MQIEITAFLRYLLKKGTDVEWAQAVQQFFDFHNREGLFNTTSELCSLELTNKNSSVVAIRCQQLRDSAIPGRLSSPGKRAFLCNEFFVLEKFRAQTTSDANRREHLNFT